MIKYELVCTCGHRFDGWFSSSDTFDNQLEAGHVVCPLCNSVSVSKQLMAPQVSTSRRHQAALQEVEMKAHAAAAVVRQVKAHMTQYGEDVGDQFAKEARKIHYGEGESRLIYGKASVEEAKEMVEEDVEFIALPDLEDEPLQ